MRKGVIERREQFPVFPIEKKCLSLDMELIDRLIRCANKNFGNAIVINIKVTRQGETEARIRSRVGRIV